MPGLFEKYHKCNISSTLVKELIRNNDLQESTCVCTNVHSGVVLTTQDVLYQDTYIFLLQLVRATRKVSYMRYK